ncbi:hypothetical protein [Cryobacterium sp. Y50]|uniref:hypothetical protein n=1 Tax=Cryobacterium sp. Y50 TaxID=2048286 RepID=UPI0013049293|nr:hypothetical protein [Cryobacterium sp. Y50]
MIAVSCRGQIEGLLHDGRAPEPAEHDNGVGAARSVFARKHDRSRGDGHEPNDQ